MAGVAAQPRLFLMQQHSKLDSSAEVLGELGTMGDFSAGRFECVQVDAGPKGALGTLGRDVLAITADHKWTQNRRLSCTVALRVV